ncbi:hypothetical protein [Paenibacillus pinihumi]|uniref:hypothetical protein n=1 Tax=Paenibacillus pinihumi TaxID=669462 RepID=UPI000412248F|nr:hypothetical protein [Paenibacillus pinihumi]
MGDSLDAKGKKLNQHRRYDTETSAELSIPARGYSVTERDHEQAYVSKRIEAEYDYSGSRTLGIVALCFALASWLVWPALMGATSAVIGYMAYRQGSRSLGIWSISLGLIAIVSHLVIIPLYFAFS